MSVNLWLQMLVNQVHSNATAEATIILSWTDCSNSHLISISSAVDCNSSGCNQGSVIVKDKASESFQVFWLLFPLCIGALSYASDALEKDTLSPLKCLCTTSGLRVEFIMSWSNSWHITSLLGTFQPRSSHPYFSILLTRCDSTGQPKAVLDLQMCLGSSFNIF